MRDADIAVDDLDYLRARILQDSQAVGQVGNLELISDPRDEHVICRLKTAAPELKQAFAAKFGGFTVGDSVFFKVVR